MTILVHRRLLFSSSFIYFVFSSQYLAAILGAIVFLWYRSANSLATKFDEAMSVEAGEV